MLPLRACRRHVSPWKQFYFSKIVVGAYSIGAQLEKIVKFTLFKNTLFNFTLCCDLKKLNDSIDSGNFVFRIQRKELERVKVLENENVTLRENLNEFLDCKEIKCFANGKYVSDIRGVHQVLAGMGASAGKMQEIVRSVLQGLGKSVDRLPGSTFGKMMT